jgi:hypothetical protein
LKDPPFPDKGLLYPVKGSDSKLLSVCPSKQGCNEKLFHKIKGASPFPDILI